MSYFNHYFFDQSFQTSPWRIPLSLAIGVHILIFFLLIMPPSFLIPDHDFTEIQTIDLFTADELPQIKEQPQKPAPAQNEQKPQATDQVKSIAIAPEPVSTPAKVISLRPRKMKKKITPVKEEKKVDLRLQALARIQAKVEEKKQTEQVKHDLSSLRDNLHRSDTPEAPTATETQPATSATNQENASAPATSGGSSRGMSALRDEALNRYYVAIHRKINKHWALPPSENWDNLAAIYIIMIRPNGTINRSFFEKKSKNKRFNQHVERLIQASQPLPPFPSFIKKNKMDIGLSITSGGVR